MLPILAPLLAQGLLETVGPAVGAYVLGDIGKTIGELKGPAEQQFFQNLRYEIGWNDVARQRSQLYRLQKRSVIPAGVNDFGTDNLAPLYPSVIESIRLYHSRGRVGLQGVSRDDLEKTLNANGIALLNYQVPERAGNESAHLGAIEYNRIAQQWRRLVDMAATAAPIGAQIYDSYRLGADADDYLDLARNPDAELEFAFARAGMSRPEDRVRLLYPFFRWSVNDILRLYQAGLIDVDAFRQMLKASGMGRETDQRIFDQLNDVVPPDAVMSRWLRGQIDDVDLGKGLALAGITGTARQQAIRQFAYRPLDPDFLLTAAQKRAWDNDLAQRWGLDAGLAESPAARYWIAAQGATRTGGQFPDANDRATDWLRLQWRTGRVLPDFAFARVLQHRLRPAGVENPQSVVPGIATWNPRDTRDILRVNNIPDPIAEQMMGLVYEPINIRLINHILGPQATHPNVKAAAVQAFGAGVDWVKNAMLDHGFSPDMAGVAAAGIYAAADDKANAEMLEEQKALRRQARDINLKRYAAGLIGRGQCAFLIIGEQFTAPMAQQAMDNIDLEREYSVSDSHIAAIKEGYMSGKLSLDQVSAQMMVLQLTDESKVSYIQEWTWKRADNQRMLSTGEILQALKRGLMAPALAQQRLINLGWTQSDSLIQIAQVEQELAQADQHRQSTEQAKQIAARLKAERAAAQSARAAATAERKAAQEAAKHAGQLEEAPAKLEEEFTAYNAAALLDRDAYNKAQAKGDTDKTQAEIDKAHASFEKLLLENLRQTEVTPEISHAIPEPTEIPIPAPSTGAGNSPSASTNSPSLGATASQGGGTGPPANP